MRLFRLLCLGLAPVAFAGATTVRPPSFAELVDGSALVFRGRVTAVESRWSGNGAQRHLATWVTFAVERTLKGEAAGAITLEFMGGERDGQRLEIAGMPRFVPDERGVFFLERRDGQMCPLRRLRHGRYRVVAAGPVSVERVARDDHTPLREPGGVQVPLAESGSARPDDAAMAAAMTLPDFERAIIEHVQQGPTDRTAVP